MAGLSMKEIARIIEFVEPQGVEVTRTKKGLLLRLPNGKSEMIHFTNSDHRAFENSRARLHRAGIELPTDRHALKNLPDYITAGSMRPATLERAARVISDMGSPRKITATEFLEAGGAPNHTLANRTLYHLGWLPSTDRKRAHKVWLQPIEKDEEPMTEEQLLERVATNAERPAMEIVQWRGTRGSLAEQLYGWLAETGLIVSMADIRAHFPDANVSSLSSTTANMKARGLLTNPSRGMYALHSVPVSQPEPEPEPEQKLEVVEAEVEEEDLDMPAHTGIHGHIGDREFIDSVNSWVLDLGMLDPSLSLGSVKDLLRSAALDFELRVWHANENQ